MKFLLRYIIPFNILFDIILLIVQKGGFFPLSRAFIMFLIVIYFILSKPGRIRYYSNILFFSIYVLIILLFSSDFAESFGTSLKILLSILFYIVGFSFFNSKKSFSILNKSILIGYFIILSNLIVSNIFDLGEAQYSEDNSLMAGNLSDNWNLLTYSLLLFPMIYVNYPKTKIPKTLSLIVFFTLVIFVLLSMKRIAIVGLIVGLLIYGFFNLSLKSFLRVTLVSGLFLGLTFPIYSSILETRFEARSDRFEQGALEEEGRYLETFYVWEEVVEFDDPEKQLFGLEAFNSVGNYADGIFGKRMLHVDYNNIVNTIGLVGLLLYFTIFFQIFKYFKKYIKKRSNLDPAFKQQLKGVFYTFLITQFITSIAGQMYALSFRMIIFIYLGAIVGLLKNNVIQSRKNNTKVKLQS